ncbi:haloacid dehalogenase type II [Methylovirgula sp. HY1]|uniref:haloacid dehalogenase type II n=1 Tax=Methylovirgula sp. HY1 TaxID=2822761 RepID=UPI001C5B40D5|nr:haloacid dehalogenase type II [Methylovirgula sp. HY1]QXX74335.1 (S)-2-haloacid dehalogenase 4A [Methylovirgula sp. HY1]
MSHPLFSPRPTAYIFDAYGTLFDVHSAVARHRAAIGDQADRLSEIWRLKQLEYTWVRSLCGAYRDFAVLTAEALDFAAARCGGIASALRADLIAAYQCLDAYPEVRHTLAELKGKGARLAILSNGTQAMLQDAIASAGLADLFEAVLSVDDIGIFKTAPQAYALVASHMGVAPDAVSFQSSNRWDVAGAARFGFRAVWINRSGLPDEYLDLAPVAQIASLEGLLNL